jgi:hypothetical protein
VLSVGELLGIAAILSHHKKDPPWKQPLRRSSANRILIPFWHRP